MANTGNGTTISFATSGFTGRYVEIGGMAESLPVLNNSDLSTTGHEEVVPGDLMTVDPITCQIFWNPDLVPPVGTVETVTITLKPQLGQLNGSTLSGKAFINSRSGPTLANNQLWRGEFTLQFDGTTGPAYAAGS